MHETEKEEFMNKNDKFIAQKLHTEYSEQRSSEVDKLRSLDSKVKVPASIFAYTFGILGALILGMGMCLAMKVIGNLMALGIVIGIIGIFIVSINYPIYKAILKSRKAKYGKEIIALSEQILNK